MGNVGILGVALVHFEILLFLFQLRDVLLQLPFHFLHTTVFLFGCQVATFQLRINVHKAIFIVAQLCCALVDNLALLALGGSCSAFLFVGAILSRFFNWLVALSIVLRTISP